jgi:hypothetical protein
MHPYTAILVFDIFSKENACSFVKLVKLICTATRQEPVSNCVFDRNLGVTNCNSGKLYFNGCTSPGNIFLRAGIEKRNRAMRVCSALTFFPRLGPQAAPQSLESTSLPSHNHIAKGQCTLLSKQRYVEPHFSSKETQASVYILYARRPVHTHTHTHTHMHTGLQLRQYSRTRWPHPRRNHTRKVTASSPSCSSSRGAECGPVFSHEVWPCYSTSRCSAGSRRNG